MKTPALLEVLNSALTSRDATALPAALFRIGETAPLASLVVREGVKEGSAAADLIAEVLQGTFKRPPHAGKTLRIYRLLREVWLLRAELYGFSPPAAPDMRAKVANLQDVYAVVGERHGMAPEAVEKTVRGNAVVSGAFRTIRGGY